MTVVQQTLSTILQFLQAIWREGDVREIRAFDAKGYVTYGYFDSPQTTIKAISKILNTHEIYITLNPCNPVLLARCSNRLKKAERKDSTTSDKDIQTLRFLLVDCDPERPSKISSNNDELKKAQDLAEHIQSALGEPLIYGMSGNGYHLIYEHDRKDTQQLKAFLEDLNEKYGGNGASVDLKVFNPARITKVLGTWARKGDSTVDRPHRQSHILNVGTNPTLLHIPDAPVAELTASPKPAGNKQSTLRLPNHKGQAASIEFVSEFLNKYNRQVKDKKPLPDGRYLFVLMQCEFDSSHKSGEASVIVMQDGTIAYQCFHNSCSGKTWQNFRDSCGDPKVEKEYFCHNCQQPIKFEGSNVKLNMDGSKHQCRKSETSQTSILPDISKKVELAIPYYSMIPPVDALDLVYIQNKYVPTGIPSLDTMTNGGMRGLVILGGETGLGKTTFMINIGYHAAKHGHPVLYVSYELGYAELRVKLAAMRSQYAYSLLNKDPATFMEARKSLLNDEALNYMKVIDTSLASLGIEYIKNGIVALKEEFPGSKTPLIIVDYLQGMPITSPGEYRLNLAATVQILRDIVRQQDVVVAVVSATNTQRRGSNAIHAGVFRETSEIEYSAYLALVLGYREDQKENENVKPGQTRYPYLSVVKNRFGCKNIEGIPLVVDWERQTYTEREEEGAK